MSLCNMLYCYCYYYFNLLSTLFLLSLLPTLTLDMYVSCIRSEELLVVERTFRLEKQIITETIADMRGKCNAVVTFKSILVL